jgi:hypothetical protein
LTDWNIIEMVCMDNANFLEFEQEVLRHNSTETPKEK